MSTTYTREQLELVYKAGQRNIPLDDLLRVISLIEGEAATPKKNRSAKTAKPAKVKKGKRAPKGKLGEGILKYLQGKGAAGAHVKDIAAAVNTKPNNITAWLYSTGKVHVKAKTLKKVKPATYAYIPGK
jgi:hypothetical protein